jgi:hypothetical protein
MMAEGSEFEGVHSFVTTSVTTGTDIGTRRRMATDGAAALTCADTQLRITADALVATENRGVGSSILPLATRAKGKEKTDTFG